MGNHHQFRSNLVISPSTTGSPDLRFNYDNAWLADFDEFDTSVYSYDGTILEEILRLATLDESGNKVR